MMRGIMQAFAKGAERNVRLLWSPTSLRSRVPGRQRRFRAWISIVVAGLVFVSCTSHYYTFTAESSQGTPLAFPERRAQPMKVCTVNLQSLPELTELLEARGHDVIPLSASDLSVQRPTDEDKACEVVVLLERAESDWYPEITNLGIAHFILTVLTIGTIPKSETGYVRFVLQIIQPSTRKTERILLETQVHRWNGWISYEIVRPIEMGGQYGRNRLRRNLRALSAIEAIGTRGQLSLEKSE
ncbi:MAG: hypothetical protein KDK33_01575 [Leptospiraceae bacterium]|nr:hypothetical protein [Leptospiraceae bacterium]